MRIAVLLVSLAALGCPADRTAIKTIEGPPIISTMPMNPGPPPAVAIIGSEANKA